MTNIEAKNLEMSQLNDHLYANDKNKIDLNNKYYEENYISPFNEDGTVNDADSKQEGKQVIVNDKLYTVVEEIHTQSGLDAFIVKSMTNEITLSIRGTEAIARDGDIKADAALGIKINPQSMELVKFLKANPEYIKGINNVTGHSLGGGIGIDISIWLDQQENFKFRSYLYDPAPFTFEGQTSIKNLQDRLIITIFDQEYLSQWTNDLVSKNEGKEKEKLKDFLLNGKNPADYFDQIHIIDDGKGIGFKDHELANIIRNLENGTQDDLLKISFAFSPNNELEEVRYYQEKQKLDKIKELKGKITKLNELKKELQVIWEDLEKENKGVFKSRKFTKLHEEILKHIKNISKNKSFENFYDESKKLYKEIKNIAKVQQYNNIKYEEGYVGQNVEQIVEEANYNFKEIGILKQKVYDNYTEVEEILKKIKDMTNEYGQLNSKNTDEITEKVKASKEELKFIKKEELNFVLSVEQILGEKDRNIDITKEIQKLAGNTVKPYFDKCEEIRIQLGAISHGIKEVEDIIAQNQGDVFYKQYEALKKVDAIFYKEAKNCIYSIYRFKGYVGSD